MKRKSVNRGLSLLLALSLCFSLLPGRPAGAAEPGGGPTGLTVTLDKTSASPSVSGSFDLLATVTPTLADAVYEKTDLTWGYETSDSSVVQVAQDGTTPSKFIVTPQPGSVGQQAEVSITVTWQKGGSAPVKSPPAKCTVTVQHDAATDITLSTQSLSLEVGRTQALAATVTPDTADSTNVTWASSNTSIGRVAPASRASTTVTAVAPGTAIITAASGGKTSPGCTLTVPGITLNSSSIALVMGSTTAIGYSTYGGIGTGVEWSSNREDVATVSGGTVSARGTGTAIITATVRNTGYSASCTVSVRENTAGVIAASASAGQPLSFSSLADDLNSGSYSVVGSQLSYITGLRAATSDGVLYYGYVSADNTGAGVGAAERYYYTGGGIGDRVLSNVSFVPNVDFTGTYTDIVYTGWGTNGRSFQGTIRVTVEKASSVSYSTRGQTAARFQAADFNSICRARNGRDLDYVTFSLPTATSGTLYLNYTGSALDTKVTDQSKYYRSGNPSLDNISFVPATGFVGTVSIQYSARDTMGYAYMGRVVVTVLGGNGSVGDINYSVARNQTVTFDLNDFSQACRDATGGTLNYVRFDLPSYSHGTLYYNYTSSGYYDSVVSDTRNYYRSQSPYINRVTFVPSGSYSGDVKIDFTGWNTSGERFSGVISIAVGSSSGVSINYTTAKAAPLTFKAADFDTLCRSETGYALNYVRFELPPSSQGTLYYNYVSSGSYDSRVVASRSYYENSSPYLDRVTFVPASGYSGTSAVDFTGWDTKGNRFTGTIYIKVGAADGTISYTTVRDKYLTFNATDFNDLSLQQTGYSLKYVRFELPAAAQGTLYYRYTSSGSYESKVSTAMSYYRSATPYVYNVSFVPATGYSGIVSIPFAGYDINGTRFSGVVSITVGSVGAAEVAYSVTSGRTLTFDDGDFNALSKSETGENLSYVRFTLPSSSVGVLYYNYTNASKYDSKVSETRSYYRSSSPYLSSVTFVPASGYTGTVALDFSAWNVNGKKFSGTATITVKPGAPAGVITYNTGTAPVSFRTADFQTACSNRGTGSLSSVVFTPPASSQGKLYYDYKSPTSRGSAVSPLLTYTPSGSLPLSKISFVPAADFSGICSIAYSAKDSEGSSYTGTVQIVVTRPTLSTHFSDMAGYTWAVPAVEYLYENGVTANIAADRYYPANPMTRGDFMLMLCRALNLSATGSGSFLDVNENSYYGAAVNTAQALGIAQGDGYYFYPERSLSRQDAAVFLQRAMRAAAWSVPDGNSGYLTAFSDRGDIAAYATSAMASMVELGLLKGGGEGKIMPAGILSRAEMAVIMHRAMTQ